MGMDLHYGTALHASLAFETSRIVGFAIILFAFLSPFGVGVARSSGEFTVSLFFDRHFASSLALIFS